jgi:hypothetical protein
LARRPINLDTHIGIASAVERKRTGDDLSRWSLVIVERKGKEKQTKKRKDGQSGAVSGRAESDGREAFIGPNLQQSLSPGRLLQTELVSALQVKPIIPISSCSPIHLLHEKRRDKSTPSLSLIIFIWKFLLYSP